jgi:hypothetical protein
LSRGSYEGNLHSQPNLPARPHDISALRRVHQPRSVLPLGRIGPPFSLLLARRTVPKHTSADVLRAWEPLWAHRATPRLPRDSEEPRGHPYRCRRALPNRIVASQALTALRRMGRGSLDSLRGPDEPSADHGSHPSATTLNRRAVDVYLQTSRTLGRTTNHLGVPKNAPMATGPASSPRQPQGVLLLSHHAPRSEAASKGSALRPCRALHPVLSRLRRSEERHIQLGTGLEARMSPSALRGLASTFRRTHQPGSGTHRGSHLTGEDTLLAVQE